MREVEIRRGYGGVDAARGEADVDRHYPLPGVDDHLPPDVGVPGRVGVDGVRPLGHGLCVAAVLLAVREQRADGDGGAGERAAVGSVDDLAADVAVATSGALHVAAGGEGEGERRDQIAAVSVPHPGSDEEDER